MSTPLVTVYMPAYNSEKYISEAIDSIINQSFRDFEFIIIDDGSSDKTSEIISQYKDKRIRLIHNAKNIGVRKASNIALREAKGKYIARMDSDDISLQDRIEKQVSFLESNPNISVLGGQLRIFGQKSAVWNFPLKDSEIKSKMFWETAISQPSSIIRADILHQKNIFYSETGEAFGEDWEFFHKLRLHANFANLPEILIYYRKPPSGISESARAKSWSIASEIFQSVLVEFRISYSEKDLFFRHFILGHFIKEPTPQEIFDAKQWLDKIIQHNNNVKIYPPEEFRKTVDEKWDRLFFMLVPYGIKIVRNYFKASRKIKKKHFVYYAKFLYNRLIGRNNIN